MVLAVGREFDGEDFLILVHRDRAQPFVVDSVDFVIALHGAVDDPDDGLCARQGGRLEASPEQRHRQLRFAGGEASHFPDGWMLGRRPGAGMAEHPFKQVGERGGNQPGAANDGAVCIERQEVAGVFGVVLIPFTTCLARMGGQPPSEFLDELFVPKAAEHEFQLIVHFAQCVLFHVHCWGSLGMECSFIEDLHRLGTCKIW